MSEVFGTLTSGEQVHRVTLTGGGLTANFLTYGAVLQDLRIAGYDFPLVLGFPTFAPYLTHSPYFGAIAGRCVNRIRHGHLQLDERVYQLDKNFLGRHTLHGGAQGMGKSLWRILDQTANRVTMGISLADGHMGFPGRLDVTAIFSLLPDGVLDLRIQATTDAPTICNLAHHSYFNLDHSETISAHRLRVVADRYLPVDDELIPTGEVCSVANTRFDFREPAVVGQAHPLDNNYCLSQAVSKLRPVAWLSSQLSPIAMECRTTEPGLQLYDGSKIDIDLPGLSGRPMRVHAGLAMEPQRWTDANHHSHFPQAVLRPGECYDQHTQFVFSRKRYAN